MEQTMERWSDGEEDVGEKDRWRIDVRTPEKII